MAEVAFDRVDKVYPNGFQAIRGLDLEIADRELLVLVGPSGCGKSTALRMVAELEEITGGEIRIGGRVVNEVAPKDRDIAMVFQNYALYAHMSVYDNIGFALKLARVPKAERDRRIRETARILELEENLSRKPGQLSGGQRQRVAMGRAIVREPSAFLMDEPLSNLDAKLRVQMRAEITRLQRELGVTTVFVTHDQVEAMTMGDRVAVLKDGVLQQVDTPQSLYDRPRNVFVAAFIGSPSMNLFHAELEGARLSMGSADLNLPDSVFDARPALRTFDGARVIVGIRPEDFRDPALAPGDGEGPRLATVISLVEALGSELLVHFRLDAVPVDAGDPDRVEELSREANAVGRFDPRSRVRVGDRAEVSLTLANLHFFDPATLDAIHR